MKTQFINISTTRGLKKAERLHGSGKYNAPITLSDYSDELVFIPRKQETLSKQDQELLKQCNGVHKSVNEIINCKSCEILLK